MTHEDVLNLINAEKPQTPPPVSSINAELIADAIQDAKDVRKQALENAKQALEDAFQAKVIENMNKITPPELSPNPARAKNFAETKKIVETFREKTATYPKYISYEGAMVICVMLSMKDIARLQLSNLPAVDQEVIKSLWPDNAPVQTPTYFSAKFDSEKDFILFDFYMLKDFTINLLNAVAHPRPEDLKDVCIGQVPVEDVGDKIAVGKNIVMNKRTIQRLMGVELREQKKETPAQEEEVSLRRQPVAGRNAYEIRADVLQMAIDWAGKPNNNFKMERTDDEVISLAKKFYSFVENRR